MVMAAGLLTLVSCGSGGSNGLAPTAEQLENKVSVAEFTIEHGCNNGTLIENTGSFKLCDLDTLNEEDIVTIGIENVYGLNMFAARDNNGDIIEYGILAANTNPELIHWRKGNFGEGRSFFGAGVLQYNGVETPLHAYGIAESVSPLSSSTWLRVDASTLEFETRVSDDENITAEEIVIRAYIQVLVKEDGNLHMSI